jgi:dihydropteroate synthase
VTRPPIEERFPRPSLMGVVNVTPDSFSDGGLHLQPAAALAAAFGMFDEGAAIVDVGGESTRPGSEGVALDEELRRVLPVLERLGGLPVSIDTAKAEVARRAIELGAELVNDVTALRGDARMVEVVAASDVYLCLMHMRGEPRTMQEHAHYDDVVREVSAELSERVDAALAAGVERARVLVDPGIGFAKTAEHNLELLARCDELARLAPMVIGASRKSFIGHLTGRAAGPERMAGSLAAVAAAFRGGASVVRVHDVRDTMDFLRVLTAIEEKRR